MSAKHRIKDIEPERLEGAPGYAVNGVSLYTRHAAKGGGGGIAIGFRDRAPEQPWRTLSELIARNKGALKKIKAKLSGDLTTERRALLESDLEIKTRFLAKLLAEQEEMIRKGANQ